MELGVLLLVSFIIVPIIFGIFSFFAGKSAKGLALLGSLIGLVCAGIAASYFASDSSYVLAASWQWISAIGATFALSAGSTAMILVLLTALVFPIIFIAHWNRSFENPGRFFGLMLLAQAGITGVFIADDLLLFYFFWELALIPVYFLCSIWGGERRIAVTYKFFVYTFLGSLLMLAGILYLYLQTATRSFDYNAILHAGNNLPTEAQQYLFWLFFIAFAVKMPIFPFHTWQPDTYEQSSTPVTIVLSAVMVKMGLFATFKWLIPILPQGVEYWRTLVMILSVVGILYASLLAMVQTDMKRLVAYSSIAHIGLMALGMFAATPTATNGLILQMFNHGINVTGMWLIVSMVESRYKTRNLKELGGMASAAPAIAIAFVIIGFANIALPLTSGFVGEFMLFHGIFLSNHPYHITFMVLAGIAIILGAIYVLNMVQKVSYGEAKTSLVIPKASASELTSLIIVVAIIIILGVYPNLLLSWIG